MGRKLVVIATGGSEGQVGLGEILDEVDAHDEAQLQERMKDQPELFPVEEMDLDGPLMVVSRETPLASGRIDLLAVTRSGEVVVIEFKTGPQNPDFRSALSQVVDYGADLWGLTAEGLDEIAVAYFASGRCHDGPTKNAVSLADAGAATWADWDEQEQALFVERLTSVLASGSFRYVVVAQRFTAAMERTAEYLNFQATSAAFYLVELVRFSGGGFSAFEARTILKPTARTSRPAGQQLNEQGFLDQITHDEYRQSLASLFTWCHAHGVVTYWGTKGMSLRVKFPGREEPVSVAWAHPPGVTGWYGLSGLTLGYDQATADAVPGAEPALVAYVDQVSGLTGAEPLKYKSLRGVRLDPDAAATTGTAITEHLGSLLAMIASSGSVPDQRQEP